MICGHNKTLFVCANLQSEQNMFHMSHTTKPQKRFRVAGLLPRFHHALLSIRQACAPQHFHATVGGFHDLKADEADHSMLNGNFQKRSLFRLICCQEAMPPNLYLLATSASEVAWHLTSSSHIFCPQSVASTWIFCLCCTRAPDSPVVTARERPNRSRAAFIILGPGALVARCQAIRSYEDQTGFK